MDWEKMAKRNAERRIKKHDEKFALFLQAVKDAYTSDALVLIYSLDAIWDDVREVNRNICLARSYWLTIKVVNAWYEIRPEVLPSK